MVRIYTSDNCSPCREVKEAIQKQKLDVEFVDIETDEGFALFTQEVLQNSDGAIPSAYKEGKQCRLLRGEDDTIIIECPDDPPASDQG